jgi:hypothetical protein
MASNVCDIFYISNEMEMFWSSYMHPKKKKKGKEKKKIKLM